MAKSNALLGLVLLLAGSAAAQIPSAEATPAFLPVRAHDPGLLWVDSAWHGIHAAGDGRIYLGLTSHHLDRSAVVVRYDPRQEAFAGVADMGRATDTPTGPEGFVPQGKIHVPFFEGQGRLYFATHASVVDGRAAQRKPYPGGRFLALDLATQACKVIGAAPEGEGIITLAADIQRGLLYGLTHPSGRLLRCDIAEQKVQDVGFVHEKWAKYADKPAPRLVELCRVLAVDPATGRVFGSRGDGSVYFYDPATAAMQEAPVNVEQGAVLQQGQEAKASMWRTILYDEQERCFYGLHHRSTSLFRFNPGTMKIEPVARLLPAALREEQDSGGSSRLALALGRDRVIYHLSSGPALQPAGRPEMPAQAYLVTYDLNTGTYRDHGPLMAGDRRVCSSDSLSIGSDGRLWALASVEVLDPMKTWQLTEYGRGEGTSSFYGKAVPFEVQLLELTPPGGD